MPKQPKDNNSEIEFDGEIYNLLSIDLASGGGLYSRSMVEKRQAILDNALYSYISSIRKTA